MCLLSAQPGRRRPTRAIPLASQAAGNTAATVVRRSGKNKDGSHVCVGKNRRQAVPRGQDDTILVERIAADEGAEVILDDVVMLGDGDKVTIGTPRVEGAAVSATVVSQTRGSKIIIFRRKRRKNHRRTQGHRQDLTLLKINAIAEDGKSLKPKAAPAKKAAAKEEAAPKAAAKKAAAKKAAAKKAAPKAEAKAAPKKAAAKKTAAKKATAKKAAAKKAAKS